MRKFGYTASDYAEHLGLTAPFVSMVFSGKKLPSPRILEDIGFARVVTYRKKP
jgi:predicted transcriptional regulator